MIIEKIVLQNYRNYQDLSLDFSDKFNIIYGNNGQGKTNILESIYLCGTGRSHRTSHEREMQRFGSKNFYVYLELVKKDLPCTIEYRYIEGKKCIKINEVSLKRINKLMGNLVVVLFSPEDLILLKEDPSGRRRFMDIAISQMKPSYFYQLQEYKKILANRNALLKDMKHRNTKKDTLFLWDEALSECASKIMQERFQYLKKLEKMIKPKHDFLTNKQEKIEIRYKCTLKNFSGETQKNIKETYLEMLKKKRMKIS